MKCSEVILATRAAACGVAEDFAFSGFTTDSRAVQKGDLFIALKGETFDGHDFCAKALAAGAAAVMVAHPVADLPEGAIILQVEDTLRAYGAIASYYRDGLKGLRVFGVTGSNGKTSTKDLLHTCLSVRYRAVKNEGNFNNEIGCPMTLLKIPAGTEIAVIEMGMSGLGEIARLCAMAKPESGIITNVYENHMELLGSQENIARAKAEIVENLPETGFAVLNRDNAYAMQAAAKTRAKIVTFGLAEDADYRGSAIEGTFGGTEFTVTEKATGKNVRVALSLLGEHNVYNALAAIAGAACYGVSIEASAEALAAASVTRGRLDIFEHDGVTVINDTYNASPASTRAAILALAEGKKAKPGSRAVAVLADMRELGPVAVESHRAIGAFAAANKLDLVLTYGEMAAYITEEAERLGLRSVHYALREEAQAALVKELRPGDVLLLKGSHSMHVDRMLEIFRS